MNQLGFNVQMPDFLKGKKQLSTMDANHARSVTKVRWVIEAGMRVISSRIIVQMKPDNEIYLFSVNGKIKQWRFFSQTIQNSSIPSVRDYLNIVCALINAYHNTRVIDPSAERERAAQMFLLLNNGNRLKQYLNNLALGRNKPRWKKYDFRMVIFPACSEQYVWNLCFGTLIGSL